MDLELYLLYYKALGILTFVTRVLGNGSTEFEEWHTSVFSSLRSWSWAHNYLITCSGPTDRHQNVFNAVGERIGVVLPFGGILAESSIIPIRSPQIIFLQFLLTKSKVGGFRMPTQKDRGSNWLMAVHKWCHQELNNKLKGWGEGATGQGLKIENAERSRIGYL